jgi:two-component system response regulator
MSDKRILLVEDTPDDEDLIILSLRKSGVLNEIDVARDGEEAVKYLFSRTPDKLPTVVLLDLKLPKIDGLEVLKRIRGDERTRLLPVVILTSSDEQRDRVESYGLGANSYVRKPVDFGEFAEAARQLGLYWLIINRPPTD